MTAIPEETPAGMVEIPLFSRSDLNEIAEVTDDPKLHDELLEHVIALSEKTVVVDLESPLLIRQMRFFRLKAYENTAGAANISEKPRRDDFVPAITPLARSHLDMADAAQRKYIAEKRKLQLDDKYPDTLMGKLARYIVSFFDE